jgi:[protein-PII] uridylyltransferase
MPDLEPEVRNFAQSLPESYRRRYSEQEIEAHFKLWAARGNQPVVVGVFGRTDTTTGVCIVGQDQAGLLSRITEALVVCNLDIVNAHAFTRSSDRAAEAVDIFWLRKPSSNSTEYAPCDESDIQRLREALRQALLGDLKAAPTPSPVTRSDSHVRFLEDKSGALSTLELETDDRAGLLLALSRALFAQKVQIVHSEVRTENGRVVDRFQIAELNGEPVGEARRLEIQVAVLSAAEPAKRLSAMPPRR